MDITPEDKAILLLWSQGQAVEYRYVFRSRLNINVFEWFEL